MTICSRFSRRAEAEEMMDMPETSRDEFIRALYDIQWVNRNLGGIPTLIRAMERLISRRPVSHFRILDLGAGSADIPVALVEWARKRKITLDIVAVDLHPVAIHVAQLMAADYPEIEMVEANALTLDYPDQTFDIVISSMFLHHLSREEGIRLLQEMDRLSRFGLIINDLERHPLAWLGIRIVGRLLGKGVVFRNDAPLSVLRGYTQAEARALVDDAGLAGVQVAREKPFRLVIFQSKPERGAS